MKKRGRLMGKVNGFVAALAALACLFWAAGALGMQVVTLGDGESAFVDVSLKNLNLVKFPSAGKVYSGSKSIDVKVDGQNAFIKWNEGEETSPQEIFFVCDSGTYSLTLIPKQIPAQTVVVRAPKETAKEALQWESSHSYEEGLKDLVKGMYEEIPPFGFSVNEAREDRTIWEGTTDTLVALYIGATLQGEIHKLANISKEPIRYKENEFYGEGTVAVSIDKHELQPGEETTVYLVKKNAAQKQMEKVLLKQNPLDVLRGTDMRLRGDVAPRTSSPSSGYGFPQNYTAPPQNVPPASGYNLQQNYMIPQNSVPPEVLEQLKRARTPQTPAAVEVGPGTGTPAGPALRPVPEQEAAPEENGGDEGEEK